MNTTDFTRHDIVDIIENSNTNIAGFVNHYNFADLMEYKFKIAEIDGNLLNAHQKYLMTLGTIADIEKSMYFKVDETNSDVLNGYYEWTEDGDKCNVRYRYFLGLFDEIDIPSEWKSRIKKND